MDPERAYWAEPLREDMLEHLVITLFGVAVIVVLIGFLWKCCTGEEEQTICATQANIPMTPVYAHELEPGLVVLQSQDGQYFRILQEYESAKFKNITPPDLGGSGGACGFTNDSWKTYQCIPTYTRPHYQNRPSAPPIGIESMNNSVNYGEFQPPPYSR